MIGPIEEQAEVVLPGRPLDATLAFFRSRIGFRLDSIFPADRPTVAVVSGSGIRLRLDANHIGAPGTIRLPKKMQPSACTGALIAPNGTRVEWADAAGEAVPPLVPALVVTRCSGSDGWSAGRAGMLYRDLVPGRLGGRFIASQIRIPGGGPVADDPHHHDVRFQLIFCHRGRVRVVYEDQGEPFWLEPGDCVLQPPRIRHRVLESADDLEVIEIACPAEHVTHVDHDAALPTGRQDPERRFCGQRFVRHIAANSTWIPWRLPGFECRETGIGAATAGLAGCRVVRARDPVAAVETVHDAELAFFFVREGGFTLRVAGSDDVVLGAGDSVAIPAATKHAFRAISPDLEMLEVTAPELRGR